MQLHKAVVSHLTKAKRNGQSESPQAPNKA